MNSMELSNFLEKVRRGRKLSQEEFVYGIVSIRQYQRYRRGESEIPYEKLDHFAARLGIPAKKLLSQFEEEKNIQSKKINDFYNAVVNRQKTKIGTLKKEIENTVIIEQEKKLYFKHALIFNDFYLDKNSEYDLVKKNSDLINYPSILNNRYYTDIEILIMSSLINYLDMPKRIILLDRLSELFESDDYIMSGGNNMIISLILMRLTKGYGLLKDYPKVIHFAKIGIDKGIQYKQYYLFEFFYYYKALAHFGLEDFQEYESSLFRCYNVLHLEGNMDKISRFTQLIEEKFNINYHMFIMKYLKKEIM